MSYQFINGARVNEAPFYESTQQTCAGHRGVSGVALAVVLTEETRRRSTALSIVKGIDPNAAAIGEYTGFNASRVLQLRVPLTPPVKQQIQDACDIQFGPGRVVVA